MQVRLPFAALFEHEGDHLVQKSCPVLKSRFGEKAEIKLIEPKRSLLGMSGGANGVSARLAEASIDHLIDVAEEKTARSRFGL